MFVYNLKTSSVCLFCSHLYFCVMGVTTKGAKFKFSTNEKVLCYEPDPTKAKVLYESKVLDLVIGRDEHGRRIPEYRIHFLGWNSSWDRCVGEEFILPFTEENRQLQAKLREDAALTALSVKGKRKGKLPPQIKDTLSKKLCSESVGEKPSEPEKPEIKSDSSSSEDEIETEVHLDIPDVLKKQLEKDQLLVTKNNKLVKLPCDPNIVKILEEFVRHLASKLLYVSPPRNSKNGEQMMPEDVKKKLDTCKEVVDGIRTYFDFTLPYLLLYRQEKKQMQQQDFHLPTLNSVKDECPKASPLKEDGATMPSPSVTYCPANQMPSPRPGRPRGQPSVRKVGRPPKSEARNGSTVKRVSERKTSFQISVTTRALRSSDDNSELKKEPIKIEATQPSTSSSIVPDPVVSMETRGTARKILLTKSSGGLFPSNEFFSTSGVGSSNSSAHSTVSDSKGSCQSQLRRNTALLKELEEWKLLPSQGEEKLPSLVYGAQHLLRLFVRLPGLISQMKISKHKVDMLLEIIEHFFTYLMEQLDVLFSPSFYVDFEALPPVNSMDAS